MKFYEVLKELVECTIVNGTSIKSIRRIHKSWNGWEVHVRHQQEDAGYNMWLSLELIMLTKDSVDCVPWIPSFLDIFSEDWVIETHCMDVYIAKVLRHRALQCKLAKGEKS